MILNAVLQLKSQGEGRESIMEMLLMMCYTSEGLSNQEQTIWMSWNTKESLRVYDLQNSCKYHKNSFLSTNINSFVGNSRFHFNL